MQGHQDRQITVESSDKTWNTGERKGKALQYSCFEDPMNNVKRQKDLKLEDQPPRSVNVQYATGKEQRNWSTKNEDSEPKQKLYLLWKCLVVKVMSDAIKNSIA